ncbi:hypothetical protein ACFQJC_09325 [Haloferax namakaokahaiae]|uniref:DUF2795 domain-containing protein n=1 Tax=Haloferax namakaokahaiae TaxID=1748331 RepID=A0ABD5ZEK5_9EURY
MRDSIKLSRVESAFEDLSYPVSRNQAATKFDDVTVLMADGSANLGSLIRNCVSDEFDGPTDLYYELNNAMPIEAVGEPGQSEGDA